MLDPRTLDLLIAARKPEARTEACRQLALHIGVDEIFLLVNDPLLGNPIPALGMAQTVRGGRQWRRFAQQCSHDGEHPGQVDVRTTTLRPAIAFAVDGAAIVMVGGEPSAQALPAVRALMPLVAAVLTAEHRNAMADSEVGLAKEAVERANAVSAALESARFEAMRLNAQLAEEDSRKDEFLAMLAHELRNPLAGVLAASQVLRMRVREDSADARAVAIIERQARQLARLVDDLTDVARVSQGQIGLKVEQLDLRQALADAIEANRHAIDENGLTLQVSAAPDALWVRGDAVRLTQVFSNLVHNAAKYTDAGGQVSIEQGREGNNAVIRVADNGIGISEAMLPLVFEMFRQAPVAIARSQGGLGLGLTLARRLLALHQGSIEAHSAGIGHGSVFTVRLPLDPAAGSDAHCAADAAGAAAVPQRQPGPRPLRVLVADDNVDAAQAIGALLGARGHQVDVVHSGTEALDRVGQAPWDLLVLDLGLPDIDGYAVARSIRQRLGSALRLVALTGYDGSAVRQAAADAGFDAHFVKPCSETSLDAIVGGPAAQP